jgi:hypothetical protein
MSVTFYALFPQDSSATFATPGCSLVAQWPSSVTDVYWFNETSLYYEYDGDGDTYYDSCFSGSYGQMINPYYAPPASISASTTTPTSTPGPTKPTTDCSLTDHELWIAWSVWIPIPYAGANNCDELYKDIERGVDLTDWQCVEKDLDIQLWFNTPTLGDHNYGNTIDPIIDSHYKGVTSTCGAYFSSGLNGGEGDCSSSKNC